MPKQIARLVPDRDGYRITEENTPWQRLRRRLLATCEAPLGLAAAVAGLLVLGATVVDAGLSEALAAGTAPFGEDNRMLAAMYEPVPVSDRTAPLTEAEIAAATLQCAAESSPLPSAPRAALDAPRFVPRALVRPAAMLTPLEPAWRLERLRRSDGEFKLDDARRRNLVVVVSLAVDDNVERARRGVTALAEILTPEDRLTVINDFGGAGIVLPATPGGDPERVGRALACLYTSGDPSLGSTADLAYRSARASFIDGGINRVIVLDEQGWSRPGEYRGFSPDGGRPMIKALTSVERNSREKRLSFRISNESVRFVNKPPNIWSGPYLGPLPPGEGRVNEVRRGEEALAALLDSASYAWEPVPIRISMGTAGTGPS